MTEGWDARIAELGITITEPLPQNPMFPSVVIDGNIAYTSGIVAVDGPPWSLAYAGVVGEDLTIEEAAESAAQAMRCTLANLKGALGGSLDRVDRFLKIIGFVRCRPDFFGPPKAVDGASQVLIDIFGPDRAPARSAIGVASLPGGASVEVEAVVRLRD